MHADQVREVLLAAADLIEPPGAWCQRHGTQVRADGTVSLCAYVAIHRAARSHAHSTTLAVLAAMALGEHVGVPLISTWNDEAGRTQPEVVSALREAAR
jgi:hypothetical protein